MLGVDVVKEILMGLSGMKILLLLIKVSFYREGGLLKMFGDEASGKARPLREVDTFDGGDEGVFDGDEG